MTTATVAQLRLRQRPTHGVTIMQLKQQMQGHLSAPKGLGMMVLWVPTDVRIFRASAPSSLPFLDVNLKDGFLQDERLHDAPFIRDASRSTLISSHPGLNPPVQLCNSHLNLLNLVSITHPCGRQALGEAFCGSTEAVVRVDMSEMMERHSVSKLIGSPPGENESRIR